MKLYQSQSWLKRKYIDEGMSADQIAKVCGVSEMTITRYLQSFGLIRNSRSWSNKRK